MPHWRGIFADKKIATVAPVSAVRNAAKMTPGYGVLPPRRTASYAGTPTNRLGVQQPQSRLQEKPYPRRSSSFQPGTVFPSSQQTPTSRQTQVHAAHQIAQQQLQQSVSSYGGSMIQASHPVTPYQHYMNQNREIQQESPLINSLLVAANDDRFTKLIDYSKSSDITEWGFCGNVISLPSECNTVNVRLVLDDDPFPSDSDAPHLRYEVCIIYY